MRIAVLALLVATALAGCVDPRPDYTMPLTAADFVAGVDNPFLPYPKGAWWIYEVETPEGTERIEVRVENETRTIMGVAAMVVRDTVTVDGVVVEDTYDWYGQDRVGNVWYLGEDTCEYEDGACVDRHGAWEWGVEGALPGIVMWADPVANGTAYFQEFWWGEAVDEAAVIELGRTVTTLAGTWSDTVTTKEWNRLEPDGEEHAHHARGVGVVLKEVTKGDERGQRETLVAYHVP